MNNAQIKTSRLLLRKYIEEDRAFLVDLFTDEEIGRYMGDGEAASVCDANQLFNSIFNIYEQQQKGNRFFEVWGIELNEELIGHFELKETEHTEKGELEVVYIIDKPYWNKGFISEVLQAMQTRVQKIDKKIIATVDKNNQASIRVLEKLGIKKVKTLDSITLKIWI